MTPGPGTTPAFRGPRTPTGRDNPRAEEQGRPRLPDEHRPQADRHQLHGDELHHVLDGRRDGGPHADPARCAQQQLLEPGDLQPALHDARQHHAVPLPGAVRLRHRQLPGADPDRRPRHGVPAVQRLFVLAVPRRLHHHELRLPHFLRCGRLGLVRLCPSDRGDPLPWRRRRPVDRGRGPGRLLQHVHRDQPDHNGLLPAGARHDHVPHADLRLEPARYRLLGPACLPRAHGRPGPALGRQAPWDALLRPDPRGPTDPVAEPVLVLRPPRGLHPGAAVLRDGHRGHLDLLPQACFRLQGHGFRDSVDRRPVNGRLGAPHVHHRRRAAAVLHRPDPAHLGAHRASSSSTGSAPCSGGR